MKPFISRLHRLFLDIGKDIVFQAGEHLSPEGFHVVDAFGGDGFFGGDEVVSQL